MSEIRNSKIYKINYDKQKKQNKTQEPKDKQVVREQDRVGIHTCDSAVIKKTHLLYKYADIYLTWLWHSMESQ